MILPEGFGSDFYENLSSRGPITINLPPEEISHKEGDVKKINLAIFN